MENGDTVIALSGADGSVSLEPAGQFELSGAPLENLHQTCAETGAAPDPGQGGRRDATGSASSGSACGPTRPAPNCR